MNTFSSTFNLDLEKLLPSRGVYVVRAILDALETDPFLAIETVHEYLSRWRTAQGSTWASEYPYAPKHTIGVTTYRFSDTVVIHYLDTGRQWDSTIIYQSANKRYTVDSFNRLMDNLEDKDYN